MLGFVTTRNEDCLGLLTEPPQEGRVHQTLLGRNTGVLGEQVSQEQDIELRLVVAEQDSRPQLIPSLAVQQAVRVFNLKPYASEEQHGPLEAARGRPLSQATVSNNVQACRGDGAVGCADEEGGEGSDAAGVVVDLLALGDLSDDVEDLRGEEDCNGTSEDPCEDGGECHDRLLGTAQ